MPDDDINHNTHLIQDIKGVLEYPSLSFLPISSLKVINNIKVFYYKHFTFIDYKKELLL